MYALMSADPRYTSNLLGAACAGYGMTDYAKKIVAIDLTANFVFGSSVLLDMCGSTFDTVLFVSSGCPSSPSSLSGCVGNDDSDCGSRSRVTLTNVNSRYVYAILTGYAGATGNMQLAWSVSPLAVPSASASSTAAAAQASTLAATTTVTQSAAGTSSGTGSGTTLPSSSSTGAAVSPTDTRSPGGADPAWLSYLVGQTYSIFSGGATFSLAPFQSVTQGSTGWSNALGHYSASTTVADASCPTGVRLVAQSYTGGDGPCGGNVYRSTTVSLVCGASTGLTSASEPSMCLYALTLAVNCSRNTLAPGMLCVPVPSATGTPAGTPSVSGSAAGTPLSTTTSSEAAASSATTSQTGTGSGTPSRSAEAMQTPTLSAAATQTSTPSGTATQSFTPSATTTQSPTLSATQLQSPTLSAVATRSLSGTGSSTGFSAAVPSTSSTGMAVSPTGTRSPGIADPAWLSYLVGQTYSIFSGFSYSLTPFGNAMQGGSGWSAGVGRFSSSVTVADPSCATGTALTAQLYTGGDGPCPNGVYRSTTVLLTCGASTGLTSASEPSMCSYALTLTVNCSRNALAPGTLCVPASATPTPSGTPSGTPTVPASPTRTPTSSGAPTGTATGTPTLSGTATPSTTTSGTRSGSGSIAPSATSTASRTSTASQGASGSNTGTPTPSRSSSGSAPPPSGTSTPTSSISGGAAPSTSPSRSPTASNTPSVPPSGSATGTPSLSRGAQPSGTPTRTAMATQSATVAATATRTASPTGSASLAGTPSGSLTATLSAGAAASGTATRSGSSTASATVAATASTSATASLTRGAPVSATASATASPTGSGTLNVTAVLCGGVPVPFAGVLAGPSGASAPTALTASAPVLFPSGACASGYSLASNAKNVHILDLAGAPGAPPFVPGGVLRVDTCAGSNFDTTLYVGVGCPSSAAAFQCQAGSDDACGVRSAVTLAAVSSPRLFVVVSSFSAGVSGSYQLTWSYRAPSASPTPSSTPLAGAAALASAGALVTRLTGETGRSAALSLTPLDGNLGISAAPCAAGYHVGPFAKALLAINLGPDAVIGSGSQLTISTCGGDTNFDSVLHAGYSPPAGSSFVCAVGSDDFCGLQSSVTLRNVQARVVWVIVSGYAGRTGRFRVSWNLAPPPPPPSASPSVLPCSSRVSLTGTLAGATGTLPTRALLPSAPVLLSYAPCPGYSVTGFAKDVFALALGPDVPLGGTLRVDTCGSGTNFDTTLWVGSGCPAAADAFVGLGGSDDACGLRSAVTVYNLQSLTLYVLVSGYAGSVGSYQLSWSYTPPAGSISATNTASGTRTPATTPTRSRTATPSGTSSLAPGVTPTSSATVPLIETVTVIMSLALPGIPLGLLQQAGVAIGLRVTIACHFGVPFNRVRISSVTDPATGIVLTLPHVLAESEPLCSATVGRRLSQIGGIATASAGTWNVHTAPLSGSAVSARNAAAAARRLVADDSPLGIDFELGFPAEEGSSDAAAAVMASASELQSDPGPLSSSMATTGFFDVLAETDPSLDLGAVAPMVASLDAQVAPTSSPSASSSASTSASVSATATMTGDATSSSTSSSTGSETGTASSSQTASVTGTVSSSTTASVTGTASSSQTASVTGTASSSQTASVTGTASSSQTATSSSSQTGTGSSSQTSSLTGTASIVPRSPSEGIVVMRVGSPAFPADSLAPGTALPVTLDFVDVSTAQVWRSAPFRWTSNPDANSLVKPCTLAAGSGLWNFDSEGLPSLSVDGKQALVPCYNQPAGSPIDATSIAKTIGSMDGAGTRRTNIGGVINTGIGAGAARNNTGWRQVVSVDGASAFWTAGIAANAYGVRYIGSPPFSAFTSTRIYGRAAGQGATNDIRALAIARGPSSSTRLWAMSSSVDPGFDTIFAVGSGLPAAATADETPLRGMRLGSGGLSFVFASASEVWVSTEGGELAVWRFAATMSRWARAATYALSTRPLRSLTGRREVGRWVAYAADNARVYRFDSLAETSSVVATAPPGSVVRGVILPPAAVPTPSTTATASRSASAPRTRTRTRTKLATRSRTGRPRKLQEAHLQEEPRAPIDGGAVKFEVPQAT